MKFTKKIQHLSSPLSGGGAIGEEESTRRLVRLERVAGEEVWLDRRLEKRSGLEMEALLERRRGRRWRWEEGRLERRWAEGGPMERDDGRGPVERGDVGEKCRERLESGGEEDGEEVRVVYKNELGLRWEGFMEDLKNECSNLLRVSEFQLVHELCLYVLSASCRTELIRATRQPCMHFFRGFPYIFESPLWFVLILSVLDEQRNLSLRCLTEVVCTLVWEFYDMQVCENVYCLHGSITVPHQNVLFVERSLWRKKRRYVDPDASTSQVLAQRGMDNFMILRGDGDNDPEESAREEEQVVIKCEKLRSPRTVTHWVIILIRKFSSAVLVLSCFEILIWRRFDSVLKAGKEAKN
ncbi:hypothetical protein Syun_027630 [Stephania yunnanensis]|uniref:Uncharacterized protein n=1 Tax=Stephania yunnanensis TaxID=152371 RepID=A0AAP0EG94_9MAGN